VAEGELLTQYYPRTPYNFDVPPNPYLIGPLKSILQTVEARFNTLLADITSLQAQVSVQTATGVYLDNHGILYGTPRLAGEPDSAYRARILETIDAGKLTLGAIQTAVDNYLLSITSDAGVAPTADVYDLRSNPEKCAADAEEGYTVQILDFIVEIDIVLSYTDAWFVGYSYLDYQTYLYQAGTSYGGEATADPALVAAINRIKAGGTNAVFKTVTTFGS
jgi:hypothetical protein